MKVLETLGSHGGAQNGIFQYKRTSVGITLDSGVGTANLTPARVELTNDEWGSLLLALEQADPRTFRLTGAAPFQVPPNQSLHELIQRTVPQPAGGWNWNDSWKAYICAVLEHEGSVNLYHGPLGPVPEHAQSICVTGERP